LILRSEEKIKEGKNKKHWTQVAYFFENKIPKMTFKNVLKYVRVGKIRSKNSS